MAKIKHTFNLNTNVEDYLYFYPQTLIGKKSNGKIWTKINKHIMELYIGFADEHYLSKSDKWEWID